MDCWMTAAAMMGMLKARTMSTTEASIPMTAVAATNDVAGPLTFLRSDHHYFGADLDAAIEIDDVLIAHAYATR